MEALDLEVKRGESEQSHERSDLETTVAAEMVSGGDAKRPRKGNNDHHAMEVVEEEEDGEMGAYEIFEIHRKDWIASYGKNDAAAFYKPTELLPMRHTDGPVIPFFVTPMDTMEIFLVKVAHLTDGLQWPLDVYGDVAVRDSLDWKRNYLFCRDRNNCQTLTSSQDSLLELTGPSRAVMLLDGPIFEIDLKVKGKGSSALSEDDKVLCLDYFGYNCIAYRGSSSYAKTKEVPSESCAMEFRFAHIINSVEATVTAHITNASCSFSARFSAHTTSIGEDVVLLDTRGQEVVPVKDDGEITLRRRVVVVEDHHQGQLILGLDAVLFGGDTGETTAVSQKLTYYPRSALRSVAYFDVGLVRIKMCVAWSLLP
ncbi:uncharacterized protein LOC8076284 [Sorghum bicolor]|uniref:DUF6598 domain-containing protein n=1 Tax=Sorghum bicolor TaxID=4558 RepID=A0A1B6PBD3_SORBI|nr:uncharacterized protein LOC8076284 [Sorghum bicolor]KXG23079.1 hypothetical protein SORBI_3008G054200 [Sorghum bicolor]|eukprot:XP_021302175.1 uncharacterized protein LOC8076284 [Sorghum bicolor]